MGTMYGITILKTVKEVIIRDHISIERGYDEPIQIDYGGDNI